jgi:hypothetical protein
MQKNTSNDIDYYLNCFRKKADTLDEFNNLINYQQEFSQKQTRIYNDISQIQQISYLIRQYDLSKIKDSDYNQTEQILKNIQVLSALNVSSQKFIGLETVTNIKLLEQEKTILNGQINDYK